jgi:hypothetical protein
MQLGDVGAAATVLQGLCRCSRLRVRAGLLRTCLLVALAGVVSVLQCMPLVLLLSWRQCVAKQSSWSF